MFYLRRVAETNGFWIVSCAPQLPRKMTKAADDRGAQTPRVLGTASRRNLAAVEC
ncbi:hypothetical protein K443DRAFT_671075 [Laccaria amethystina LaAM-08-1]|uniref:Uncharacterized protein n=1 Tax=Laccaria amethystina LaAM-08-1 TaxID=1095629 RepID=A0A0C9YNZ0_9AGAR|nr:hypothetical protein K443DRAFT_671075 [Laccaria amethystina LaAM-08-1]